MEKIGISAAATNIINVLGGFSLNVSNISMLSFILCQFHLVCSTYFQYYLVVYSAYVCVIFLLRK